MEYTLVWYEGELFVVVCVEFSFNMQVYWAEVLLSQCLQISSTICLGITFITYLIFAELRNLPGVNMMSLTLSYLVSQVT